MKISIITVAYNSEQHIDTTIRSVLAQDYANVEYIIIDGASTDETLKIVNRYSNKVHHIVSEQDGGMYDAINKGLGICTGDIVGLLHSDDVLETPDVLSKIAEQFQQNKTDLLYGDLIYVDKNDINKIVRNWKSNHFSLQKLSMGWMPPHPTVYVRKELIEKNGSYDLSFTIAADYDWMLRMLIRPIRVDYLPEVIVRMRMGGASNKSVGNIMVKMKDDLRALRKNKFGGFYTLIFKNLRKLNQFFAKPSVAEHFTRQL